MPKKGSTPAKARKKNNLKVLIVEDDAFLINIYSTKFEGEGYNVSIAENGEIGLEQVSKEMPDIILLDILMPRLNGFGFLQEIKAKKEFGQIPIILLTNLNQNNDIEKGLSLGADDYLVKAHFMPSEIVEKVQALLNKKEKNK